MKSNYQQSKGAHNNNRDSSDSGEKIQFQQTFVSTINLAWQQCNERYLYKCRTPKLCQSFCVQQYMFKCVCMYV